MAQTSLLSPLLLRRFSSQNPIFLRATRPLFLSHAFTTKHFSSLPSAQPDASANLSDSKPTALSARMSFVFDQIDAIERERSQKDETLQRIRAWRESKKSKTNQVPDASVADAGELNPSELSSVVGTESGELEAKEGKEENGGLLNREVEVVHPWPEWIELMERLVQQNYFDHRRKDEDKMVEDLGFQMSEVVEEGFDFTRDWKSVQTACLNFGRDRFDILRALSRQDIQILVGYGCPSADKKVVFSAKLLRKHVHLDEGDVCSSCSLRHSCERAYLLTNKEDEARTIDVMRVLLTYGFDPLNGSVVNDSLLKIKSVKIVVRKLLHEVVKLSAVPIDPNLPPPIIKKPPPKVKQPPPPPKKRVGRDDIEMKKGDWLCPKCDFMNFAKNTVCLQCDAKRPKRQLLPGEWECPQCNFLNYRRNTVCFHCEHKRPLDEFTETQLQDRQRGPKTRLEKVSNRADVSKSWNFDFDDNESDGADVAAFEYADSQKLNEDFPFHGRAQREDVKGPEDDSYMSNRTPRACEREYYDRGQKRPGTGFDDFDDEEDDIDSYELDVQNNNQLRKSSSIDFSEVEGHSESEDVESFDEDRVARRTSSWSRSKPSKLMHSKSSLSGSEVDEQDFDSDNELPVHANWKSSHVADSRPRTRGREALSFGSDEEYGLGSDSDDFVDSDFGSSKNQGNKWVSSSRDSRKRQIPDSDFGGSSLESDDEDPSPPRGRLGGSKVGPNKRGNGLKGRGNFKSSGDSRFGSNGRNQLARDFDISSQGSRFGSNGRSQFNRDFDRSSQGPRANRGFRRDGNDRRRMNDRGNDLQNLRGRSGEGFGNRGRGKFNDRRRMNDRGNDLQNFRGRSGEGFGNRGRGRFNDSYNRLDMDRDFVDDRPRRPRINVR